MTAKLLIQEELYQDICYKVDSKGEKPISFSTIDEIASTIAKKDIGIAIISSSQLVSLSSSYRQLKKQLPFLYTLVYVNDGEEIPSSEIADDFIIGEDNLIGRIDNIITIARANRESCSLAQDCFLSKTNRPFIKNGLLVPPGKVKISEVDSIYKCFAAYVEMAHHHSLDLCLVDIYGRWDVIGYKCRGGEYSRCQQFTSPENVRRILSCSSMIELECPQRGTVYACPVFLYFRKDPYPVGIIIAHPVKPEGEGKVPVFEFCQHVAKILSCWISDEYSSSYLLFMEYMSRGKSLAGERIFSQIINNIDYGIIVIDSNKAIVLFNKGAERFLGISASQAMGKSIVEVTWKRQAPQLDLFLYRTLETGVPFKDIIREFKIRGKIKKVIFDTIPIMNEQGSVSGAILIFKDITSRVEEEKRRECWEREILVEELAASIVHEIRNPLSVVAGFLQIIRDKGKMDEKGLQKYSDMALKELDRVKQLLDGYLKQKKKGNKTRPKLINTGAFLEEYVMILKASIDTEKVSFHLEFEEGLPSIIVDPSQLRQIVLNLVQNAVQALGGKGNIWIKSYLDGKSDRVIIEVKDDGPGIPRQYMKKIFKPFFTTKAEGTGLGLFICRRLVQENGGTLEVDSKEGRGARFIISFPQCNL